MADLWVVKENTKFGTDFILLKDKPTDEQLQEMQKATAIKYDLDEVSMELYTCITYEDILTTKKWINLQTLCLNQIVRGRNK